MLRPVTSQARTLLDDRFADALMIKSVGFECKIQAHFLNKDLRQNSNLVFRGYVQFYLTRSLVARSFFVYFVYHSISHSGHCALRGC